MTTFRSNCLFWVLWKWTREGGYLAMRRSHHWRYVPHFMWSKDGCVWLSFTPVAPKLGWRVLYDKLWFKGTVKEEGAAK